MSKNQERIVVGIDVGTTKICTVVGEIGRGPALNVLGVGVAASHGLAKGMIVDIPETVRAIGLSLERAERLSGCKIGSAYVGVAGSHVASLNSRGVVAVSRNDRVITHEDVQRAVDAARAIAIPAQREVLHVIPRAYVVDGHDGVRDPVGMAGFRLEVETHIVTGSVTALQNLVRCVQRAGVEVDDLVLQPLAGSESALSEQERHLGVVLVDIGGGTTDVAVFIAGSIWHTVVLPVGGGHLSNDLSIVLKVPAEAAERLKVLYGQVLPPPTIHDLFSNGWRKVAPDAHPRPLIQRERGDGDERQPAQVEVADAEAEEPAEPPETYVDVETFTPGLYQQVAQTLVSQVLEARLEQIFGLVAAEIRRSGYEGLLPAGVVLTGGTARLPGVAALAGRVLNMPVRVSVPQGVTGLIDTLDSPAYATAVGLALWAVRHGGGHAPVHSSTGSSRAAGQAMSRVTGWLREFLP